MSNSLAIAAVTRMIQLMLQRFADIDVTTRSPDHAANGQGDRVNLFLYHTMPNPSWRNLDVPGRGSPGGRGNPPLALNLYYLLTAYGEDGANLADQRTLGHAMQVLHDRPIIKRSMINSFLPADLLASGIHEQLEHIRIAPDTLNIEEMSRLWTTFQTQYRVSAAYQAAVVLIDSQRPTRAALPVAKRGPNDRGVSSNLGLDVVLQGVEYRETERQPAMPAANVGGTITIVGSNLPSQGMQVVLRDPKQELGGSLDNNVVARLTPHVQTAGSRLTVELEEDAGFWAAGMLSLEVEQTHHDRVVSSNSVPLALAPQVQTNQVDDSVVAFVNDEQGQRTLTVSLQYPMGRDRRVMLILNRYDAPQDGGNTPAPDEKAFFQLPMMKDELGLGSLNPSFDVTHVPPGKYWSRIRVDGVDSMLMVRDRDSETNRWSVSFDPKQKVAI